MEMRFRVFRMLFGLLLCVSVALPQASDLGVIFPCPGPIGSCGSPFGPCPICYFESVYPQSTRVSVVEGSATISAAPGSLSQPWILSEALSGSHATLQVLGGFFDVMVKLYVEGVDGFQPHKFVLTVTNASPDPWTAFEIELQSVPGQRSGLDGLSFGVRGTPFQPSCSIYPPTSTKFATVRSYCGNALLFSEGIVNPGETVTFVFYIMQRSWLLPSFYIAQRPRLVVNTDLKPNGNPNCVNPASSGTAPVAIFGGATFNVDTIKQSSLKFGGAPPLYCEVDNVPMQKPVLVFKKDGSPDLVLVSEKDDIRDLVCHFPTNQVAWPQANCGPVPLTGSLYDGTPIFGGDSACLAGESPCSTGTPVIFIDPIQFWLPGWFGIPPVTP